MEYFRCDGFVDIHIRGFPQLLSQLFAAIKTAQEVKPVLFQAEHGVSGAAEIPGVDFQQLADKAFQSRRGGAAGGEHSGIADQTPADHYGIDLRVFFLKIPDLGGSTQISIVAEWVFAVFHGVVEPVIMNGASVEFLPHPWVDGQLPDGVAVEDVQQRRKFLRPETDRGLPGQPASRHPFPWR